MRPITVLSQPNMCIRSWYRVGVARCAIKIAKDVRLSSTDRFGSTRVAGIPRREWSSTNSCGYKRVTSRQDEGVLGGDVNRLIMRRRWNRVLATESSMEEVSSLARTTYQQLT
ncbi:hypothetical protein CROQUDRAFT_359258 [Cronartium quercuum f. sp. fusiforme G11]|uniref:Uncharacterized protein n=1 Tax=Cronartium quercuum f. sp. fusiforme G11 TaxID=708437 RepID=A0A9P6TE36_9BASI|nr:hypothetical protein CROQUDRAFT_359258 [Cronartium quercuum f. sp. fusiforme G11]